MNRNSYQITENILDNILMSGEHGITITPLIRKSNISYGRIELFITKLTQNNLINEIEIHDKKTFIITERGKMFLEEYKKFNTIAESFGLEL
jgi:predicted transcriptional regulator